MTKAIVHVGAGKCGSSALQRSLSFSQQLYVNQVPAKYMAVADQGRLVFDDELRRFAEGNIYGYATSGAISWLSALSERELISVRKRIESEVKNGYLVLSKEGWLYNADLFSEGKFFERLGLEAEVVIYVRAPVEWLNSAWWQWGAWTGKNFEDWLQSSIKKTLWCYWADRWSRVPGVKNVRVRLLTGDIIGDFSKCFNVEGMTKISHNASLGSTILRLFQRHRELRPSPHASRIDFSLSKNLSFIDAPTPWVLDKKEINKIIDETQLDLNFLPSYLDDDNRKLLKEDRRWWGAEFYADRVVESPNYTSVSIDQDLLSQLASNAMETIFRLEQENLSLKKKLNSF